MFQNSGTAHLQAMSATQELMQKPGAMQEWFERKQMESDGVPED